MRCFAPCCRTSSVAICRRAELRRSTRSNPSSAPTAGQLVRHANGGTEQLGREIAARGLVVASGMARGIDAIAHQGAWLSTPRRRRAGTGVGVATPRKTRNSTRRYQNAARSSASSRWARTLPRKFPDSELHRRRLALGCCRRKGHPVQRFTDHRALDDGARSRSLRLYRAV
jgi:hypothetical protein